MGTSIRDLFDTLDAELAPEPTPATAHARDAARLLHLAAPLLRRLVTDGLDPFAGGFREPAILGLADACDNASRTFATGRGRTSDLLGAASDLVGIRSNELNRADRCFVAETVANASRLAANRIAVSGPYDRTSAVAEVRYRARDVARVFAAHPPKPQRLTGLDRPTPSGSIPFERSQVGVVIDALSAFTEALRPGQPTATLRELRMITDACGAVQARADRTDTRIDWTELSDQLRSFTDGPQNPSARGREIAAAAAAVHQNLGRGLDLGRPVVGWLLDTVAHSAIRHIDRSAGKWIVPIGERQISEQRVAEWLDRKAFVVTRDDIARLHMGIRR